MYSIVLLTALTTAPDVPQAHGYFRDIFRRDNGCNGCSGMAAAPGSCSGCWGGGFLGLGLGERVRRWFDRHSQGCCGGSFYNCFGGSCFGSGYSCFGNAPMSFDPFPGYPPPMIPYAVPGPAPGPTSLNPSAVVPGVTLTAHGPTGRATVVVRLPADARLYADDRPLNLTGPERQFVTPELPTGQEFTYRFKAEYERHGEIVSITKKVVVQPGGTVSVEFGDLTTSTVKPGATNEPTRTPTNSAAGGMIPSVVPTPEPAKTAPAKPPLSGQETPVDRATITVKLPPGATLYVDDRKCPSGDLIRSFATPPLPANREFAYLLKAEVVRNGQPETITQKVPFRAGERVTVDFTSLGK